MKRFLLLLTVLALVLALVACDASDSSSEKSHREESENTESEVVSAEESVPDRESTSTPILYKVTDEDGDVLWLFGSIHVGKETFYPLPSYVTDAFDGADSLAVECDIVAFESDLNAQVEALTPLMYTDGTTIASYIPEELYNRGKTVMTELGVYAPMMDYYCPSMWSSLIETSLYMQWGLDPNLGVDRHLIRRAYEQDKEILDIESPKAQYQMLAGFSMGVQMMMLESSLEMSEYPVVAEATLRQMLEFWETGDEEKLAKTVVSDTAQMTQEQKELYAEYTDAMLTQRNLGMAEFAENVLDSHKEVFLCVGAAHILGEGALVDLLVQRGYTVERVSAPAR